MRGITPLYLSVTKKADPKISESLLHDHATLGIQDSQGWQEIHQVGWAAKQSITRLNWHVNIGPLCLSVSPTIGLSQWTGAPFGALVVLLGGHEREECVGQYAVACVRRE